LPSASFSGPFFYPLTDLQFRSFIANFQRGVTNNRSHYQQRYHREMFKIRHLFSFRIFYKKQLKIYTVRQIYSTAGFVQNPSAFRVLRSFMKTSRSQPIY